MLSIPSQIKRLHQKILYLRKERRYITKIGDHVLKLVFPCVPMILQDLGQLIDVFPADILGDRFWV